VRGHHTEGEFIRITVGGEFLEALDLGLFGVVVFGTEGVILSSSQCLFFRGIFEGKGRG
jgi:hypothetical protein